MSEGKEARDHLTDISTSVGPIPQGVSFAIACIAHIPFTCRLPAVSDTCVRQQQTSAWPQIRALKATVIEILIISKIPKKLHSAPCTVVSKRSAGPLKIASKEYIPVIKRSILLL